MHSEECPVCHGSGKYVDRLSVIDPGSTGEDQTTVCHGCKGQGWIMIADVADMEMMMKNPAIARMMGLDKFEHKGGNKDDRKKY